MKVKFIGKGTQFHPTLGKLEEGEVYDLPRDGYPKVLFEAAGSGAAGKKPPPNGVDLNRTNLPDALLAMKMDEIRGIRDMLADIDPSVAQAQDTSKRELVNEIVKAVTESDRQADLVDALEKRLTRSDLDRKGGER